MGISLGSGITSVTGSVTVTAESGLPAVGTTQTQKNGTATGAAGTNIITVTAGKTFYCLGFIIGNGNGTARNMTLYDGTTTYINTHVAAGTSVSATGGVLFTVAAGLSLKINTNSGAADAYAAVWGYEA